MFVPPQVRAGEEQPASRLGCRSKAIDDIVVPRLRPRLLRDREFRVRVTTLKPSS